MSAPEKDDVCDCRFFEEGEWVEFRLNTNEFGIVVGESDFGRLYNVQLAGSGIIKSYYGVTLQHMDLSDDEPNPAKSAQKPTVDNVIQVDFTKGRKLKADTPTEGAA